MSKTLEQLENSYWNDKIDFPSNLVKNCHQYRKISISKLTIEQLRLLISQEIGIKFLLPISLNKLKENPLAEGNLYEGDLLECLSKINQNFWDGNTLNLFKNIIIKNKELIQNEIGSKSFEKIESRIKIL